MGNEVRTTFTGDDSDLQKAFNDVGSGAKEMASDVGAASKRMADDSGGASRDIAGAVDSSEGKFRGLSDTIQGSGDVMEGFRTGNVALMATGFADLAGGMTQLVIPALTALKGFLLTGLAPAMTAISAHPLIAGILIGGAIIAGLILLEKKFGVVSTAIGFVKDAAGGLLEALGSVVRAFRDLWNSTVGGRGFSIGGVDLPGPFDIPGFELRIPRLHSGGVMGGGEGLAILQQGERVIPRGGAEAGPMTIVVRIGDREIGRVVADALRQNALLGIT